MRTALILLFLLALAAVPGSILPQRSLNPDKTRKYIASHGAWGQFLDRIDMFDVFGSVWFAAIYLLLFVSLVGCLVPRIRVHARGVARKPLPAPRNLDRLPESGRFEVTESADEYAAAARRSLGRRWRITRRVESSGAVTLSAEKGYSRESANLLFHVALLAGLILVALGQLYKYQGNIVVKRGDGFCNEVAMYDSWKPGRLVADHTASLAPFCVDKLNSFNATYTKTGEPSMFSARVTYQPDANDPATKHATIRVNHPLRLKGDRVYLISHGFAPKLTIRMPDGSTWTGAEAFVPTDATTLLSEGAFKAQGKPGADQDVGISGIFAPTPAPSQNGLTSVSPKVHDPVLDMFVYVGDLGYNGTPQSVYSLDTAKMTKIGTASLHVGASKTFSHGVTVKFDGWVPTASIQVSHDPTQGYLLIVVVAMVLGLIGSLGVRRRRLWLRITPAEGLAGGSPTVVNVGGLARSDSGNFSTEFAGLCDRLRDTGTVARPVAVPAVPVGKE
jgi:cytochrome c biogenesis protein